MWIVGLIMVIAGFVVLPSLLCIPMFWLGLYFMLPSDIRGRL